VVPDAQAVQATPPLPHAVATSPLVHAPFAQHPAHDVASHVQSPATHRSPCPQEPAVHTPSHPFDSPHALPAQLDVHGPVPQTLGAPPPPQSWPMLHPPQSTSSLQESRSSPHLPWHVASWVGQLPPASASVVSAASASAPPSAEGRPELPFLKEPHAPTSAMTRAQVKASAGSLETGTLA
jgi:hypothetical protein